MVDVAAAHKHFSAWCFNQAWELMEKIDRTEDDNRMMEALSHASIFHWSSRPDCSDRNLSIGYWQASRIQSILGNAEETRRYAQTCLRYSADLEPFYLGYAHEALARAASLANDAATLSDRLAQAEWAARQVTDEGQRQRLTNDLVQLRKHVA